MAQMTIPAAVRVIFFELTVQGNAPRSTKWYRTIEDVPQKYMDLVGREHPACLFGGKIEHRPEEIVRISIPCHTH